MKGKTSKSNPFKNYYFIDKSGEWIQALSEVSARKTSLFYTPGDILYVVAESGLNLRDAPNPTANVILTISATESLKVLATNDMVPLNRENKKGYWVKVKYKEQTGWIWDAYLTKIPVEWGEDGNIWPQKIHYGDRYFSIKYPHGYLSEGSGGWNSISINEYHIITMDEGFIEGSYTSYYFPKYINENIDFIRKILLKKKHWKVSWTKEHKRQVPISLEIWNRNISLYDYQTDSAMGFWYKYTETDDYIYCIEGSYI